MENEIIELVEIKETFEGFDERISRMHSQLQIAIDTMNKLSVKIANNDDSLHTVGEVSKILRLSPYVIRQEIKQNKLVAIQRGSRNYIRQEDLNEYIKTK